MKLDAKQIVEQFDDDWRADQTNREEALEDLNFLRGGENQWPRYILNQRRAANRPTITINRLPQFVRQITGEIRQMTPSVEVYPVDDIGDPQIAEIYEGLIRQIEYQSGASSVYSYGAEGSVSAGIGHWRVATKYADDSAFDQDIFIERIMDPLAVVWDAGSTNLDRSDAKHCYVTDMLTRAEFKGKYPKATDSDFPSGNTISERGDWWEQGEFVRIAEYWYYKPVKKTYGLTAEGETIDLTKIDEDQWGFLGITRTRKSDSNKVCRLVVSGNAILEEEQEWAGKHIPIIPCVGDEMAIDGEVVRKSLIRDAKPAQQLYNFWRSHAAEAIALAPKSPWLVTPDNIEGHEAEWNRANLDNKPYLPYNPDETGAVPQRNAPANPPTAMWTESQVAQDDMKATTGIYDSSLGQQSNEVSGKAINARQGQTDTGTFVFIDNFNAAIRRTGQILVDLIPRIYDGDRVVRVLSKEEQQNFVPINKTVVFPDGEQLLVNDLSTGRFDVRVKTGPNYTTQREQARDHLAQLFASNTEAFQLAADLYFEAQDFPGADKLAERFKKLLPPQLQEQPEDENGQPIQQQQEPPGPMVEMAQRLELLEKESKIGKTQAETAKVVAETEKTEVETAAAAFETGVQAGLNG